MIGIELGWRMYTHLLICRLSGPVEKSWIATYAHLALAVLLLR